LVAEQIVSTTTEGGAMTTGRPNIVQAEFFHVGGSDMTLEEVLRECAKRAADGHELAAVLGRETQFGIKTVVRFFDVGGSITAFAQQFGQMNQQYINKQAALLEATSWWKLRWLDLYSHSLAGRILVLKERGVRLAVQKLNDAVRSQSKVALELSDHSYRFLRDNEVYELGEAAYNASGVWLFVFEPNNLLAEKNKLVAYVM